MDYRAVFPDSKFIAQRARADSEESAKTEAAAQIARYFKTSVSASLRTNVQSETNGENSSETTSISNEIELSSQLELFALEFTEPYFFKKEKKWHCVAFIEREKAWTQFEPTVQESKAEFLAAKKIAQNETDPFLKCAAYKNAQSRGKKFLETLEFARILNAKKESAYQNDRIEISEISSLIFAEKEKCTVSLNISGDFGNIVSSALAETLSKNGFKISNENALYTANAILQNNESGSEPICVYPSLELKITNKNGQTVYASTVKLEQKTLAYSLENAQKKSFPILADKADKAISADLSKIFGN